LGSKLDPLGGLLWGRQHVWPIFCQQVARLLLAKAALKVGAVTGNAILERNLVVVLGRERSWFSWVSSVGGAFNARLASKTYNFNLLLELIDVHLSFLVVVASLVALRLDGNERGGG